MKRIIIAVACILIVLLLMAVYFQNKHDKTTFGNDNHVNMQVEVEK